MNRKKIQKYWPILVILLLVIFAMTRLGIAQTAETPSEDETTTEQGPAQTIRVVAIQPPKNLETIIAETDPEIIALLDRLEKAGTELKTFESRVIYRRADDLTGDEQTRLGSILFMNRHEDQPTRFLVDFQQMLVGNALRERVRQYAFDGVWLVERHPDEKVFIKRQLVAPGQTIDPLKLGEGPIPIPLGQKRNDVILNYRVARITPPSPEAKEADPALRRLPDEVIGLNLTPRNARDDDEPNSVQLWYHPESLLPLLIRTAEGSGTTQVELRDSKVDQLERAEAMRAIQQVILTPPAGSGWQVEISPLKKPRSANQP